MVGVNMRFSCIKKFALSGTVLCALVNAKCQADTQNNVIPFSININARQLMKETRC